MSSVEDVKSRLDIVQLIGEYVPLKKAGHNYKALCPFHQEKTPSFIVFPDSQHYHCFGCGANGDLFGFIMQTENLAFPEALRLLAQRAGVVLHPPTPQEEEADQQRHRLEELNLAAAHFFHQQLRLGDTGALARSYLKERGIGEETVQTFLLGYAPDRWDALSIYLRERGYTEEELRTAGLVVERESGGGSYDRFRHRLIFPIRDLKGHAIGFGGRAMDEEHPPKYLNSPQTPLFDKGSVLYGLDQAASSIRREGRAILVEGYFDVLMAHQSGYKNVVAPMGTALSESQVHSLKRLAQRLYLALDADSAGTMATLRGVEVIQEAMGEQSVPVPTAQGLVRFERVLDGEVRIVVLPAGRDPDEVIRADPADWEKRLAEARPVLDYVLEHLAQEADLSTARGKAEAVRSALPLLAEVHDPVERGHYIQRLAHLVQVEERAIAAQLRQGRPARARRPQAAPQPDLSALEIPLAARKEVVEGYFVALLYHFPWLREGVPLEASSLLSQQENRVLLEMLAGGNPPVQDDLPEGLRGYLEGLLARFRTDLEMEEEMARRALGQCLARLDYLSCERQLREYTYMLEQTQEEGDRELTWEMGRQKAALIQRLGRISKGIQITPKSRLFPDLRRLLGDSGESPTPDGV